MRLFDVPEAAVPAVAEPPFPLGGIGGGQFVWDDRGEFRDWRMHPGAPGTDAAVPTDRFRVWWRSRGAAHAAPLAAEAIAQTVRLFPLTWRRYELRTQQSQLTPALESVSFSPLLPGEGHERSLPVHVVAFRAYNPSDSDVEMALMLTWSCGWPAPVADAEFDLQHDNLCVSGSLGSPDSPNRQGIAVPDLHYVGIYQQGVEPWVAPAEEEELLEDFCDDGELDPRVARATPKGAAAWLKFSLEPGETKEAPFVLAWHFPVYESGPAKGLPRYYTQFLGRRRPDNAIVWLAEQAVQHYGAETANYLYWLQTLRDWQDASRRGVDLNGLSEILRADVSWTAERGLVIGCLDARALHRLEAAGVTGLWPDVRLR